ncbi:Nuclease [bioreactor metagenome]|uniref:Nuclease n=1 Tax=bioreactor metagenome TaxID=1076179 RepID=A0A645IVK0_9ZZZZ
MAYTVITMDNSFFMSNISPQTPKFNRGIWSRLEKQVRNFALTENEIYVITGPVFKNDDTRLISIGKNNPIAVPYAYYKVIYDLTPPQKMIAFIIPNTGSKKSLAQFAVTVSTVEQMTGLEFFPTLSDKTKKQLETTISVTDWTWLGDRK